MVRKCSLHSHKKITPCCHLSGLDFGDRVATEILTLRFCVNQRLLFEILPNDSTIATVTVEEVSIKLKGQEKGENRVTDFLQATGDDDNDDDDDDDDVELRVLGCRLTY